MKEQIAGMMGMMIKIFEQMETFMVESLSTSYDQEEVEHFHIKVGLMAGKSVVDFDLFDENTNTIFRYSVTLDKMLKQCANKSIYPILETKLEKMITRSHKTDISEVMKIIEIM